MASIPWIKNGGLWALVKSLFVKSGAVWVPVKKAYVKYGTTWYEFYTAGTIVRLPTTAFNRNSFDPSGSPELATVNIPNGTILDNGAYLLQIASGTSYNTDSNNIPTSTSGWGLSLSYNTAPSANSVRVTNLSTGVSAVLTKNAFFPTSFSVNTSYSGGGYPLTPYHNFIRQGVTDIYRLEKVS